MLRKLLLASALTIGLVAPALAQQNFKATTTGSIPAQVNLGTMSFGGCVYSGVTSLIVGQAVPMPCDANGNLLVDINNSSSVNPLLTKPNIVTYAAPAITSGSAGIPANIFAAGSILDGCYFVNTSSALGYVSIGSTATANDAPMQPGQSFTCPYPTSQAVSFYSASAWTIAGKSY